MRTILLDLPYDCRGYIIRTTDEECCVLNARMTLEQNQKTYLHELKHLKNHDLDSSEDINTIETRAHALDQ